VFGPSCHDCLCYSNHLQRAPYDAAFTKAWCKEMSGTIKALDPTRRVTLGDLKASMQLTGAPSCTKEDGLDYYSLHVRSTMRFPLTRQNGSQMSLNSLRISTKMGLFLRIT
jgi:endo-1,4-beta-mannosidase